MLAVPDVLETLKKLPPSCIAEIGGKSVLITRGVMGYRHLALGHQFYLQPECTDAQRAAMVVGATVGWDQAGADPDHTDGEVSTRNQSEHVFHVPLAMQVRIIDYTIQGAEQQAEKLIDATVERMQAYLDDERITFFATDGDLQLTEKLPL